MADVSLIPLGIVVCVVFPVLWMWGVVMSGTFLAHHGNKPILQQTLVDLLNMDMARLHIVAITVSTTMGTLDFLHRTGVDIPPAMFLWHTWLFQCTIQLNMIYVSYGVIVRYIYVLNQRMVFEEVSDASARNGIRIFSAMLCFTISMVLSTMNMEPEAYIAFVESTPKNLDQVKLDKDTGNASVVFAILTSTTLAINVFIRVALWKAAKGLQPSPDGAEDTTMKKMFLIIAFMAFLNLFRFFFNLERRGIPTSQFMTIIMVSMTDAIVTVIVHRDHHMKKLAKSRLKDIFGKVVCGFSKPNAVSPAA